MFSFCFWRRTKIYNGFIIRNEEFQYVFFDRSRTNGHNKRGERVLLFVHMSWKKKSSLYNFKASAEEVIMMRPEKINVKYLKSMRERVFSLSLLASIPQRRYE